MQRLVNRINLWQTVFRGTEGC